MLARTKNNERNYDIKHPLARYRRASSVGHSRHVKSPTVDRVTYVSSSDWALHRPRRLGRWSIRNFALRYKFPPSWNRRPRGAYGKFGRIGSRDVIKNLAQHEMKQFLIEQIPALFFIAVFFLMLALGG